MYEPASVASNAGPAADVDQLVNAASRGSLVIFLGAGASAAPPSSGPMGSAVADQIRPVVATWLGEEVAALEDLTLEALATRVYAADPANESRLRQLLAESMGFREMLPNHAHYVAALLLREGAVSLVTTNWDQAVETAAREIGYHAEVVLTIADDQAARTQTPVKKLHGCVSVPTSLRVSQEEVDQAGLWSETIVSEKLLSNSVVFVGYGTVAKYVETPIRTALASTPGYASALTIVSRSSPASWKKILDGHDDAMVITSDAETFFDALLCGLVKRWLDRVSLRASIIAQHEVWGPTLLEGVGSVLAAVGEAPADRLLRWWRTPATSVADGQSFVGSDPGIACLIAVGHLASKDGDVRFAGHGRNARVETSNRFIEIACRPGRHFADVRPAVEGHVRKRHLDGVYSDNRPVTVVIDGVDGSIPAFDGEPDIAADGRESVSIDSSMTNEVGFLSAADVLSGRVA